LRTDGRLLGAEAPAAVVFINDPERAPESLQQALARLYGLTPAECKVTEQLLNGASVAEVAERLGITAPARRAGPSRTSSTSWACAARRS
jgi:DNA-binding NarL/FixJ family response regulator